MSATSRANPRAHRRWRHHQTAPKHRVLDAARPRGSNTRPRCGRVRDCTQQDILAG